MQTLIRYTKDLEPRSIDAVDKVGTLDNQGRYGGDVGGKESGRSQGRS